MDERNIIILLSIFKRTISYIERLRIFQIITISYNRISGPKG